MTGAEHAGRALEVLGLLGDRDALDEMRAEQKAREAHPALHKALVDAERAYEGLPRWASKPRREAARRTWQEARAAWDQAVRGAA